MKKILHITPHLGGGAGKAVSGIITELTDFENTVLMLESPVNTKYSDVCKNAEIPVIVSFDTEEIRQMINSADIVVLNWWAHPLEVKLLQNTDFGSTPVVLWSHINGLNYPYLKHDFLKCFDGLMFTSPCSFENPKWTERERSEIISGSEIVYGTGKFFPEKLKFKSDHSCGNRIKICYTGTLDYSKMNRKSPYIINQISKKNNNVEFFFYGGYSEQFKNEFLKKAECENVFFCGFSNDIENVLTTMDIFCYPLAEENYATTENALLEAMAAGLPCVVMANPAESSIIENGETGFTAKTAEEFSDIVLKLCRDEALRERIGINARNSVIEKYSFNVNSDKFRTYLNNVRAHDSTSKLRALLGNDPFDAFRYFCGLNTDDDAFEYCRKYEIFYSESKSSPFHYLKYFSENAGFLKLTAQLEQEHKNGN
ncbi:MAG: glycosyltransferase family 4 protein [Oscillospiraceae bacterium]